MENYRTIMMVLYILSWIAMALTTTLTTYLYVKKKEDKVTRNATRALILLIVTILTIIAFPLFFKRLDFQDVFMVIFTRIGLSALVGIVAGKFIRVEE